MSGLDEFVPPRRVAVPGRVNLMGDHTDYNGGLVLPMAVDRWCEVHVAPRGDGVVRAVSGAVPGVVELALDDPPEPRTVEPPWGRFVAGAIAALRSARAFDETGVDLRVASTVPVGSGLSSSSALAVALTLALGPGLAGGAVERARVALDAEIRATGVPGGLMDQLTVLLGVADHALLIDCRSFDVTPTAIAPPIAVLVAHCGRPRTLAGSEYAARRAECEAIAAHLGLESFRDATAAQVADAPRARHVVAENARVIAAADALAAGDVVELGRLMLESHTSLRDDYEVSTPELDALVAAFVAAGARGARLTGAGFGGCVVAVAERERAEQVLADAVQRYRDATGLAGDAFVARAVEGASPLTTGADDWP